MKFLGLDYGSKRVGVAVSNEEGTIAFPRVTLHSDQNLISEITQLVQNEKVQEIVIGDTRSHGGVANEISKEADAFAAMLEKELKIPVRMQFEAWSSVEASRHDPEGPKREESAAAIILQRYLDMKK